MGARASQIGSVVHSLFRLSEKQTLGEGRPLSRFVVGASFAIVLAGAGALAGCSQGGDASGSSPAQVEAVDEATAEEQSSADGQQAEETLPPDAYETAERDPKLANTYHHSDVMDDGLTADEIANSMGYESLLIAVNSEGTNEVATGIQLAIQDMGYTANSSWEMTPAFINKEKKTALFTSYGWRLDETRLISMNVFTFIQDGLFHFQLNMMADGSTDYLAEYEYDSDTVPTPEDALQLLQDNS